MDNETSNAMQELSYPLSGRMPYFQRQRIKLVQRSGLGVSFATLQRFHSNLKVEYAAPGRTCPPDVVAVGTLKALNMEVTLRGTAEHLISIECKIPSRRDVGRLRTEEGERVIQLSMQGLINVITYPMIILSPSDSSAYSSAVSQQVKETATLGSSRKMIGGKFLHSFRSSSLNTFSVLIKPAE